LENFAKTLAENTEISSGEDFSLEFDPGELSADKPVAEEKRTSLENKGFGLGM
jgi:hypothetical protein